MTKVKFPLTSVLAATELAMSNILPPTCTVLNFKKTLQMPKKLPPVPPAPQAKKDLSNATNA